MKVLGTIFTGRLSWNENIDSIVKKGRCKNAIDKKKSFGPNYQEMVHLWKTFCLSIFDHLCAVLGGMITTKNKKDLEHTLQN